MEAEWCWANGRREHRREVNGGTAGSPWEPIGDFAAERLLLNACFFGTSACLKIRQLARAALGSLA